MSASLFRTGLLPRLALALAFAVSAFGGVILLERRPTPITPVPAMAIEPAAVESSQPAAEGTERITIESVSPVSAWRVRLDGETAIPDAESAHTWTVAPSDQPDDLFVDAVTDAEGGRANALRFRLESSRVHIEWTEWLVSGLPVRISLEQLRASAPPGLSSSAP